MKRNPAGYTSFVLFALFASVGFSAPDLRMVEAAKAGDRSTIRSLLQQGVDANGAEIDGSTSLHWAVRRDDVETAKLLIDAGASVKVKNRYEVTPLSLACTNGNAEIVSLLLNAGADPNTILPGGETALMTASRTGKLAPVKALLSKGANVNVKEGAHQQTALMWAAAEGNTDVVKELIEHGADIHAHSIGGFTPFLYAVREGRIGVVRELLKAGVDVNETWQASRRLGATGSSALVLAVANGHFELAAALLDAGADPNAAAQGWTALHEITWVRKPGTGTNNPGPEGSGEMDSLELVRRLIAHGANVNARMTKKGDGGYTVINYIGATPFLMAARTADAELMRFLYKLGADPLLPNADNTPPLTVAAGVGTKDPGEDPGTESEVLEAVKVALELGGDVNAVDNNGETPIHGAAYKAVPSVAQLLLDKGAKVEIWSKKNKSGWTPLRISNGIYRQGNLRCISAPLAALLTRVMSEAGMSTAVEAQILDKSSFANQ